MKRIVSFAFLLLIGSPSFAAQSYGSGNINDAFNATLVAVNDQICYNNVNLAAKLSTVQWTVTTAGSGGITVQISKDYGTNSIAGVPYSVVTSTISSNPSTAPWVNNSPVVGSYETPLPSGATNFCILYQTGGTATTITLAPGKPYVSGSVVTAILYDQTSSVAGALDTGTLDFTGWSYMLSSLTGTGGTPAFTWKEVDSTGAGWFSIGTAAASTRVAWSSAATGASASVPSLPDRLDITAGAVALVTNRIRVVVRR